MTTSALPAVLGGVTAFAFLLALLAPRRLVAGAAGFGTVAVGVTGIVTGVGAIRDGIAPITVDAVIPLAGMRLAADATSGFFMVITGAVATVAGLYAAGYARLGHGGSHGGGHTAARTPLALLPLFVAAMLAVPLADSVTTFLVFWELMALASLMLVLAEPGRAAVRDAGVVYAAMTHLGFVVILIGLAVFAAAAGSEQFSDLATAHLTAATRTAVFLCTVAGFGSKAGLLPLHAWLPRAHPEAPSPVSALMSAAMVNLGIYGIVRVDLGLLGPGPRWWGLVLLAAGALTAVYGVLQASVATDVKRLLAYSTSENMGLICVALGTAALLAASSHGTTKAYAETGLTGAVTLPNGQVLPTAAAIALTAAFVHLAGHAAFKALGFMAAGAAAAAAGTRDLDALGGLATRMPTTTTAFGIAALGASGLPLGAGFVGEWLLIQSLVRGLPSGGMLVALVLPLALGVVALTTGLGVAAMVKAFGIGFLARPRSAGAEQAHEVRFSMRAGMVLAALACAVLAVAPAVLGPTLARILPTLPAATGWSDPAAADSVAPRLGTVLRLPGGAGSMSPGLLAVGIAVALLLTFMLTGWRARRRPAVLRGADLWACGGGAPTARMQYTATSFAEPLSRVFDGILRPETEFAVVPRGQSEYLAEKATFRFRLRDTVEVVLYRPVLRAVGAAAALARWAHRGSIHAYLALGALGLIIALVVAQ